MNKFTSIIISIVLLTACGSAEAPQAGNARQVENAGGAAKSEVPLTGEITISAYDAMTYKAFLDDAAKLFTEKHPGTKVNVEIFSEMPEIKTSVDESGNMILAENPDNPQSRQDYINTVNTALMSGSGADILAIDVLPFYKYADGGLLENLSAYIESDSEFNKSDYRTNIFNTIEYENGTWFLPLDYTFNFYAYDSALLTGSATDRFGMDGSFTAEELFELAEPSFDGSAKVFDRPDYTGSPRPDIWSLLLAENYTTFVDIENKTANFNDGSFEKLLETVKRYGEQGYLSKGATGQMMQRTKDDSSERFFFRAKNILSLIAFFTRDLGMEMGGMGEGDTMAIGDDDEIAGIEASADGTAFTFSHAYGISSHSKNKETAWAFLKFLLNEEMQLNTNLRPTALPVLNSAREKKMELLLSGMMGQQGQSVSEAQLEAIANFNEAANKLSDQIGAFIIRDTIVDDMIAAETRYFFEGTKSASDVASVLQNKVNLYLNE